MKKILFFFVCLFLITSVSTAIAGGYPMAAIGSFSGIDAVVVGKFDSSDFTFAEANQISQILGGGLSLLGLPGAFLVTPQQLQSIYGITDADALKNFVFANYKAAGLDLFIFLDINKVNAVDPALSPSLRADVWLAGTSSYMYLLSIEIPLAYIMSLGL